MTYSLEQAADIAERTGLDVGEVITLLDMGYVYHENVIQKDFKSPGGDTFNLVVEKTQRWTSPTMVCGWALGKGEYCRGERKRPWTHSTHCPAFSSQ